MSKDVSVVITSHNSASDLPACIESLFAHRGEIDMSIVVSDAGSSDATREVAGRYPVSFLPGENRGYAAAINRALGEEEVARSRYVLVLNPDTAVLSGTLADLIMLCDARPQTGIFTVRQLDEHGRLIPSLYRFPSPRRYWCDAIRMRRFGHRVLDEARYEHEATIDWAVGAFLLVRREVLEGVGWFDEQFFLTSEEVDLCNRAKSAGWDLRYLPSLTIMHRYAPRPSDPWRAWLIVHYQVRYAKKWFSRLGYASARAAILVAHVRKLLDPRLAAKRPEHRAMLRAALGLSAPPAPSAPLQRLGESVNVDAG